MRALLMRLVMLLGAALAPLVLADDVALLDVGIEIFDPGSVDAGAAEGDAVFPAIREAESRYLPVVLKKTIEDSGQWGVVRVLPPGGRLAELLVQGRIVEANGRNLRLRITATDATGRVWLQREYRGQTTEADFPVPAGADPFSALYAELADDLLAFRGSLEEARLREIRRVALLRYAASLSPEAFDGFLAGGEGEPFRLQRLPARGDPMIERVLRIRNQEYLFVDSVDEQYVRLHDEMAPTYMLWLQYDREQFVFTQDYTQRAARREKQGRRGSFVAMQQNYFAYRNYRLQQQGLQELALGFKNETAPTRLETQGRVFRLTGTLDSQYAQWRKILQDIFALETGLPPVKPARNNTAGPQQ